MKYAPCFWLLAPLVVVAAVVRSVELVDPPAQIVKQLDEFLIVETRILKLKLKKEHSGGNYINPRWQNNQLVVNLDLAKNG